MRLLIGNLLVLTLFIATFSFAQEESPEPAAARQKADRYTAPDTDVAGLMKYIEEIRSFEPESAEQALLHHRKARIAIHDAARKILKLETDKSSKAYLLAKTIELGAEMRGLIAADADERRAYIEQIGELLSAGPPGRQQLDLVLRTGDLLESLDPSMAIEFYKRVGPVFTGQADRNLASHGRMMEGAVRRLELPGQEIELKGQTVEGKVFDVADLKGKVVLVEFWSTTCAPCVADMPHLRKLREKYAAQGFEIVGVSLDDDRPALEEFLASRKLPWIIVHDQENAGQHPAVLRYGVFATPTLILVGKDGKVLDVTARGRALDDLLAEQFGEKEATESK